MKISVIQDNFNNKNLSFIFLHGLMSDKNGSKSLFVRDFCQKNSFNFLAFDNLGHGESDGEFVKENISSWLKTAIEIIDKNITSDFITIGSSMGGWLSLLISMKKLNNHKGQILLAPAPDFTKKIWNDLSKDQKIEMKKNKFLNISSKSCDGAYPISYQLIEDGENHLILDKDKIDIEIPTIIIQGMKDYDVNYQTSLEILDKITSKFTFLKLLKNSSHRLSDESDLKILESSIKEIISIY